MRSSANSMQKNYNRFDAAMRGIKTDRTPIWFMRQAGRYLPEYREIRKDHTFDQMLADADIATEITLQPIRRFDLDAAIIFADIMTPLKAADVDFHFNAGGPTLSFDHTNKADLEKLDKNRFIEQQGKLSAFLQAIRQTRSALPEDKAVIGFAASPFTLASYLVEGTTSKTHNKTRAFMAADAKAFDALLTRISAMTIEYLKLQIAAGVSAVQLFDSWGDVLSPQTYSEHILPHIEKIVTAINPTTPVIVYDKGASIHIEALRDLAARTSAVVSLDWRIALETCHAMRVQGNLDPALLESTPEAVRAATRAILEARGGRPGHIFNLGHGISPQAHLACVEAMVETVQGWHG